MAKLAIWSKDKNIPLKIISTEEPPACEDDNEYKKMKRALMLSILKKATLWGNSLN